MFPDRADYVIVGGGSAGCVLAARLSEDPRRSVLLVEAGADFTPGCEPEDIADAFPRAAVPAHLWPELMVERVAGARLRPFEQARVMGGGSSVMGMLALRGSPADYDEWASMGADGWGWSDVLPYFRRIETDMDFDGPLHGKTGPLSIRRHLAPTWPPFCRAVAEAMEKRGLGGIADLNGDFLDGVGPVPMTNSPTRRQSVAMAYLDAAVRARPNLVIVAGREVASICIEGRRVTGIRIGRGDEERIVTAGHVVLSAGAIHSPALMLASDIGPRRRIDRQGVGANLQNHPVLALSVVLRRHATQNPAVRPAFHNCVRYSSGHAGSTPGDMFMTILNKTALHSVGARIGGLMLSVYKSYSKGEVTVDEAEGRHTARVRFNLLSDPRDLNRLADAVALAGCLLASSPVRAVAGTPFFPVNGALIRKIGGRDGKGGALAAAAALVLDAPPLIRRLATSRVGPPLEPLLTDELARRAFVRDHAVPAGHVCGTCRIGARSDPAAVVDGDLTVIGVDGLSVVDASVMPSIVRANTNLAVVMIAERAADMIKARER